MNAIEGVVPELFGGAADLTSSTKTIFKDSPSFHVDPKGRNVFFGVREFGMMAMVNGMAAHAGIVPFGSTFFVFSDYCKPALRLGALMGVHSLYIFTHDSVDPGARMDRRINRSSTLMALRAVSEANGLPASRCERDSSVLESWRWNGSRRASGALKPSRIYRCWTRRSIERWKAAPKARYACFEAYGKDLVIVATGSEVTTALKSSGRAEGAGILATVVRRCRASGC